jgi:hypothetical protein
MSANILARMAEPLPTIHRTAGEWLTLSRKYKPLGAAIAEVFGESVNAHALGQWLLKHQGQSADGIVLTGRYSRHKKQWLYHAGEPTPVVQYVPPVQHEPLPCPPLPVPMTEAQHRATVAAALAAMAPKPKPPEAPRHTVRFTSPNVVVDGPSGSMIRNVEPVDAAFNPHYVSEAPRPAPYVPKPLNVIYTPNPQPRQPGVDYGQNGTQTRRNITGVSFSPFDIF